MSEPTIDELVGAISDFAGCGCCSSNAAAEQIFGDQCPTDEDGWTDHNWASGCIYDLDLSDLIRRAIQIAQQRAWDEGYARSTPSNPYKETD